jgi:ABC-2 type transport system ATP-binding protein
MAIIDVRGLTKRYPGRSGTAALDGVDFRVEEGAVVGLLGANGAGKTTLIKVLAGLLVPDAGGGTVLHYDLRREPARIRAAVSLVAPTADVGIDNNLTVRQNLAFWAPIYGLYGHDARRRIEDLLARLDLVDKADAWPMHISAGQRQRLALARSLLAENRLVFLDEPTNKLDADGVRSVRTLIADLNRQHGVTILLTTHVMEEAEDLCSEIAFMAHGRITRHLPTEKLLDRLGVHRAIRVEVTVARETPEAPPAALFPAAVAVDWQAGTGPRQFVLTVWSTAVAETTPAVLAWARQAHLHLDRMRTDSVTLEAVFRRLSQQEERHDRGA